MLVLHDFNQENGCHRNETIHLDECPLFEDVRTRVTGTENGFNRNAMDYIIGYNEPDKLLNFSSFRTYE